MPDPRPLLIAGPTAVGKSAVALSLARSLNGEIISVDSMQVYRGMDIGTAKPTPSDRAEVPHHLIDVVHLGQSFDAAEFVKRANAAVAAIQERGRIPIFCGGTGLYFKAYLHGLAEAPSDRSVRANLAQKPLDDLLDELKRSDPTTYDRIDHANRRRILRALEVIRLTSKPFSEQRAPWNQPDTSVQAPGNTVSFFMLDRDKTDLRCRIDARVEAMFREGLVDEVRRLLANGLGENETAMQALGYRQVADSLLRGTPLDTTVRVIKQKTWQFAKRQITWFRHQLQPEWILVESSESVESLAKTLEIKYLRQNGTPSSILRER